MTVPANSCPPEVPVPSGSRPPPPPYPLPICSPRRRRHRRWAALGAACLALGSLTLVASAEVDRNRTQTKQEPRLVANERLEQSNGNRPTVNSRVSPVEFPVDSAAPRHRIPTSRQRARKVSRRSPVLQHPARSLQRNADRANRHAILQAQQNPRYSIEGECEGVFVYIVTISVEAPSQSAATLSLSKSDSGNFRRVGQVIGDFEVVAITDDWSGLNPIVWLRKGNEICKVRLDGNDSRQKRRRSKRRKRRRRKRQR